MTDTTSQRRVALLGGSFNPPHICHVLMSVYLLETVGIDEVWWLPVHRHAFAKDAVLRPFEHRLAMCREVAEPYPGVRVDDIERWLAPPSYTFDTVAALRAAHEDCTFSWLIGSDILPELHLWHRWTELREQLRFVVVGRGTAVHPEDLPDGGEFVVRDFALPDVSSSAIRSGLADGADVSDVVPRAVTDYLAAHPELYR
ncbi:MAG: nicotinate (nicotinamide) nucleotide adenylyltransferase [Deltaproteobacteria bacterium]|nr:nicotinate (nicotinamide) nucleotide adenylyltransferase [Deltaproteobacteria bacterium]